MLICRGDDLGAEDLRQILGAMALELGRRMLLGRWDDGATKTHMITMEDSAMARSPTFEPITLALADGTFVPADVRSHDLRPWNGASRWDHADS